MALLSNADLRQVASAASEVIAIGQTAYRMARLGPIREHIEATRDELIRQLAIFEDGAGFGRAPGKLLCQLRYLEQFASDLLEADDVRNDGTVDREAA